MPTTAVTTSSATQTLPSSGSWTIQVASTGGFSAGPVVTAQTSSGLVQMTCSGVTATSLTVTPSMPVATQPASFAAKLKSAAPGTPSLAGKTVTITYGDGSTDSGTTDAKMKLSLGPME